jgi:hypothetical protein
MKGTSGVDCSLYANSSLLADDAESYLANAPVALAGFSCTWGRQDTNGQPETSTAQFVLRQKLGGPELLTALHVGDVLEAYASGVIIAGDQGVDVAVDGSFEIGNDPRLRMIYSNTSDQTTAYETRTKYVLDAKRSIKLAALRNASQTVVITPAPKSSAATAWDEIPVASVGQMWTVRVRIWSALATTAAVNGAYLTGPLDNAPINAQAQPVDVPLVAGQWTTATLTFPIDAAGDGRWVGMYVSLPGGQTWTQTPGTWAAQTATWEEFGAYWFDQFELVSPPMAVRRVLVFRGRVTDLVARGASSGAVELSAIAADQTADLGNDDIGDVPWNAEAAYSRVARILSFVASATTADISTDGIGAFAISYQDVDSQPAMDLLSDVATSIDAVLWSAFHTARGFYLWYEDPNLRASLGALTIDPDSGLVVITGNFRPTGALALSACDVLRDPFQVEQDVTDVLSRVDLTWLEQTVDDQGVTQPTERHILLIDWPTEDLYGQRRLGYQTMLSDAATGQVVATRVLARAETLQWRTSGITWDTRVPVEFAQTDRDSLLTLLDGTQRIGQPISISDMPPWSPQTPILNVYVEGGTYTYEDAHWTLELNASPSSATGNSAKWQELPSSYTWQLFDPSITWVSLEGVAAVPGRKRTASVPAYTIIER